MKDDSPIVSQFSSEVAVETPFVVDFSKAKQLDRSGSTCDAYVCTVQQRRVFVKRLKPQYRNNPLYLAAFSKEYELGVSLSHPSLPRYVAFVTDYIVIDFIEGDTLADLMKRNDSRLKNKKFVKKLMRELIDVVEYLHNRNIVHCDIKPDNIIISPYHDRPATLIDFDKAYSPWLDSTYGNTANYGCDKCADGTIDFKGIGIIAAKLGLKSLANACNNEQPSADKLRKLLDHKGRLIVPTVVAGAIIAGFVIVLNYTTNNASADSITDTSTTSTGIADTTLVIVDTPRDTIQSTPPAPIVQAKKPAIDNDWIAAMINEHATKVKVYKQRYSEILECDTFSNVNVKRVALIEWVDSAMNSGLAILSTAYSHYWNLPDIDVANATTRHPAYIRLNDELNDMMNQTIEWNAKVSQRRSDPPVSQPDTIQGDTLLAPRH